MHTKNTSFVALAACLLIAGAAVAEIQIDSNTFGGLRARSIGPAAMSGRIAAMDAVPGSPLVIYVGSATGGVWKSKDGGVTWSPIFDEHPQSIGAIKVDPTDSDVVWVGTGETWSRNSVSVGTGLYKSTDAGDSWQLVGLEDSERIARIVIDSKNSDTVYVCATGHLWGANEERGVYKTSDGGENWERILYVDEDTGCSDIAIDPQAPNVLYAGMWQFRRSADYFTSGGPGSGLYKSVDGGESWTELTDGLPEGEKGRIAVAVAPSRPNRVYALVESKDTALFRSDDLGTTWEQVNNSFSVSARPFYFTYMVVDPEDYDRIYKPGFFLAVSTDGGKAFSSFMSGFGGGVHSDHHALWVNPEDPHQVLLGTDGGVYESRDRAGHWRFIKALPVSQFYEVSYDMEWPYNVFGGLQDNGTWMGPSRAAGGIMNRHWKVVGFGDGFHAYRDPHDTNILFVEYQGGQVLRHHLATEEIKYIAPLPGEGEDNYRWNWNTAMHLSPNTPGTLYVGAQYLFRSRDRGESWEKISPDLTTNDPQRQRQKTSGGLTVDNTTAENNTTIYSISESTLNGDVIWVGTDDGLVQLTRDGGATWTNVTGAIEGLPEGLWVSHVEASPHDESTAHVTIDGHRSGDKTPYVFRTTDFGASWQSLVSEGLEGFARVIVQDLENPELLFVGTEFGLYVSLDGGTQWARFKGDLPMVPVHDLTIHPREGDLIIGTHGRGIYILDDLSPLRALTTEILESDVSLLPSRDAVQVLSGGMSWFNGDDEFTGRNPPEAATIFYYQKKRHIFGPLKLEIYDEDGEKISTVSAPKVKGLNRALWPMRLPAPKMPPATSLSPAFVGPRVPEGTYTFKLIKGKETLEGEVRLVPDPRSPHSADDRRLQQETALELYDQLARLTYVIDVVLDLKDQAEARSEEIGGKGKVASRLEAYVDQLEDFRTALVSTSQAGIFSGDEKLREHIANIYNAVANYDGRPTQSQLDRTGVFNTEMLGVESRFDAMVTGSDIAALNSQLQGRNLEPLSVMSREDWEKKGEESTGATTANLSTKQLKTLFASRPVVGLR